MSHFATMVIGKDVEQQLAPYHEFECTGTVNEYVQTIDRLPSLLEDYAKDTRSMRKGPDGQLLSAYDDFFYRDPTEEESAKIGPMGGSGVGGGLSYTSKDWGDGEGYRTKVKYLPEGWEDLDVPVSSVMSLVDFIKYQHSDEFPILQEGDEPDLHDICKWGWARVNAASEVIEYTDRTNPNKYIWKSEIGQKIATSYGDANLPFLLEKPSCGGEFLLDSQGRLVHLLQGLHQAEQQIKAHYAATPEVAHQGDIWDFGGRVPGLDVETELLVRDLLDAFGIENRWIFSGSLSFDREGERATLHELQLFTRACKRRNIHLVGCDSLSGVVKKQWVSGPEWDWWVVGGRWSGFLKLKQDAPGSLGERGLMGSCANDGEGRVDAALKGAIDFEGMRDEAGTEAAANWDRAAEAKIAAGFAANTIWDAWDVVRERHPGNIEAAREEYHAQEVMQAVKKALDLWNGTDKFLTPREEFIQQARDSALVLFGVVKDSKWFAKGEMGWFGMSTGDMTQTEWNRKVNELLDELPDDTMITVVDCHI